MLCIHTHKITTHQIDADRNLVYVRGQVPGPAGTFVFLRDAFRWRWPQRAALSLPFPTTPAALAAAAAGGDAVEAAVAAVSGGVSVARRDGPDPYERYRSDVGEFAEGATWKTE
jgi:large subunit ribosomal protein L3